MRAGLARGRHGQRLVEAAEALLADLVQRLALDLAVAVLVAVELPRHVDVLHGAGSHPDAM